MDNLTLFQYTDDLNEKHLIKLNKEDNYTIKFFSERYNESFREVSVDKSEKF